MDENNNYTGNYQSEPQYNKYQNGDYQYYEEPRQSNGFGIASMVLGILSLVLFCTCINIPMAILAIIFAVVQLSRGNGKKGFAVAGLITSVLSVILLTVIIVLAIIGGSEWVNNVTVDPGLPFNEIIEDYYGDDFYNEGGEYTDKSPADKEFPYGVDEKNDI